MDISSWQDFGKTDEHRLRDSERMMETECMNYLGRPRRITRWCFEANSESSSAGPVFSRWGGIRPLSDKIRYQPTEWWRQSSELNFGQYGGLYVFFRESYSASNLFIFFYIGVESRKLDRERIFFSKSNFSLFSQKGGGWVSPSVAYYFSLLFGDALFIFPWWEIRRQTQ